MLVVDDVHKAYGSAPTPALAGVSLTIAAGEICGLLGPNGAGKTTLASIVAGLRRPDRGSVLVAGVDVVRAPFRARALLGYAPQELGVYPLASVRENLSLFAGLAGMRGRTRRARIEEVAELLGLSELLGRPAGEMSGGEQRRLHTAMALLHRPRVVLLDEPTVGADVETRNRILEFVRQLAADGAAVCYSTHYLTEVEELDASVALIDHGRIVARGSVRELLAAHATSMVELRFPGPAPLLSVGDRVVAVEGDRLRIVSADPATDAAVALRCAAAVGAEVRSVDFIRPSLDTVFLKLTGRRLALGDGVDGDVVVRSIEEQERLDVVAS